MTTSYKKTGFMEDYDYLLSVKADKAPTLWNYLNDSQDDLQRRFGGLLPTGSREWAFTRSFFINLVYGATSVDNFDRTARLLALTYLMLRTEEGRRKLFNVSPIELQSCPPIQWYDSHPSGVSLRENSLFGLFKFNKEEGLRFIELKEILDAFLTTRELPVKNNGSQSTERVEAFVRCFIEASSTSGFLFDQILAIGSENESTAS